ncbi:uncharacterized protein FFNC_03048 [Fusarium fujikuroi]|nr:uncharacterized protein FFNC_03048 [Fusarium fujikuroi]
MTSPGPPSGPQESSSGSGRGRPSRGPDPRAPSYASVAGSGPSSRQQESSFPAGDPPRRPAPVYRQGSPSTQRPGPPPGQRQGSLPPIALPRRPPPIQRQVPLSVQRQGPLPVAIPQVPRHGVPPQQPAFSGVSRPPTGSGSPYGQSQPASSSPRASDMSGLPRGSPLPQKSNSPARSPSSSALPRGSISGSPLNPSRSRQSTIGSSSVLPTASPASGKSTPSRSRALTAGSQQSSGQKEDRLVAKAIRVIKAVSPADVQKLSDTVGQALFMTVEVGDVGTISNTEYHKSFQGSEYPLVKLFRQTELATEPVPRAPLGGGKCLIPASCIEVGAVVTDNPGLVHGVDLTVSKLSLETTSIATSSPISKFLGSFLTTMATTESRSILKALGVPTSVFNLVEKKGNRDTFIKGFLNGMSLCDSLKIFQDGIPVIKDVWRKGRYVNVNSPQGPFNKAGTYFYLLIYYDEKTGDVGLYVGKTSSLYDRFKQHSVAFSGDNATLHYRMARQLLSKDTTQRLFPITFFPEGSSNHSAFCAWAESFLAVLFECFNPVMLGVQVPMRANQIFGALPDWGRTAQQDAWARAYTRPLAEFILDIGRQVKDADPSLKSFNLSDRFIGLNWAVPLGGGLWHDAHLWIRTPSPAEDSKPAVWSFRTSPKRLTVENRIALFYGRGGTYPAKFRPIVPVEGTSLGPGSFVNAVVEITTHPDIKHPNPFVKIPTVGPFDCWNDASRLGIRVEFQDKGQWKTRYLKADYLAMMATRVFQMDISDFGEEIHQIELCWLHVMKIMAALLNWQWQPITALSKRVWNSYVCRVRTMEFDFFHQCLIIGDTQIVNKPCPKLLTLDETSDLIEKKFGSGVSIGMIPDVILVNPELGQMRREKCDLCYMLPAGVLSRRCLERKALKTVRGLGVFQCPFSATLGRYCTFTDRVEDREDVGDLVYLHRDFYPVQLTMSPPNLFQYLETEEMSAEEAIDEEDGGGDD